MHSACTSTLVRQEWPTPVSAVVLCVQFVEELASGPVGRVVDEDTMENRRKYGGCELPIRLCLRIFLVTHEGLGTLDEVVLSRPLTETPSIVEHVEDCGLHSAVGIIDVDCRVDRVRI